MNDDYEPVFEDPDLSGPDWLWVAIAGLAGFAGAAVWATWYATRS